jgi:hypothetical protein
MTTLAPAPAPAPAPAVAAKPDLSALKHDVSEAHGALLGFRADNTTQTFWATAIRAGKRTLKDFEEHLLGGSEYRNAVLERFKDAYFGLVGSEMTAGDVATIANFDQLMAAHAGAPVTDAAIDAFVRGLPEYEARCHGVVRQVFRATTGADASEEEASALVARFIQDPGYDVDRLVADVRIAMAAADEDPAPVDDGDGGEGIEGVEPPRARAAVPTPGSAWTEPEAATAEAAETAAAQVARELARRLGREPEPAMVAGAARLMLSPPTAAAAFMQLHYALHDEQTMRLIDAGEAAFGRPLHVREFLKLRAELYTLHPPAAVVAALQAKAARHREALAHAQQVHRDYLGETLDEHAFVVRYGARMDDPGWVDNLAGAVMASPPYEARVRERLAFLHRRTYDETLSDGDLGHVMARARALKVSLRDDTLTQLLVAFKEETDRLGEAAYSVYMVLYWRKPDGAELADAQRTYRDGIDVGAPTDATVMARQLARRLVAQLEFHDVLKRGLRSRFMTGRGREPSPGETYAMLGLAIRRLSAPAGGEPGAAGGAGSADAIIFGDVADLSRWDTGVTDFIDRVYAEAS